MAWMDDDYEVDDDDLWDEEDEEDLDHLEDEEEEEEDEDWFPQEVKMLNAEKIEKLTPLAKAHEEVVTQQKDLRAQIADLNTKVTALEKQRTASILTITTVLGDSETFVGTELAFTRLQGSLYVASLLK